MRPIKKGLTYFPFDVDFFDDDKLMFVSARFGLKGELVTVKLLCRIYRDEGYFMEWNEDTSLLFAKRVGDNCQHSFVKDVVNELLKREFFDNNIFKSFGILTSCGIQKRYLAACETSKRKQVLINPDYDLIFQNSGIKRVNSGGNPDNSGVTPEETLVNSGKSTQRKEKKSKVEKSKEEGNARAPDLDAVGLMLNNPEYEQINLIFIKTLGRNPKIPEYEETLEHVKIYGAEKVERLFREAVLKGFKSVGSIFYNTDENCKLKPYGWDKPQGNGYDGNKFNYANNNAGNAGGANGEISDKWDKWAEQNKCRN